MKRKRYTSSSLLTFLLISLLCIGCSDDDEYVYPSALTEFVTAYVNEENIVDKIITDQKETLHLENTVAAKDLQAKSYYRTLCTYEKSRTDAGMAKAYSLKLVFAATPVTADKLTHGVKTDPLSVQSIWRSGEFLNLIVLPKAQSISHGYHFIQDSLVSHKEGDKLYLKLYHNQNSDVEAYTQKIYLSIPLQSYTMQSGDSIFVRINTYTEGLKTWKFAY